MAVITYKLSVEKQPTGRWDVVATPETKGVRVRVLARCLNEDIARKCMNAIADRPAPTPEPVKEVAP
jgi:hypothetical protein